MHGVLSVVPVDLHQLRPAGVRARLPGHRRLLRLQVAQEPARGEPGDESVRVAHQLRPRMAAEDDLLIGHEQHQQHRRVPGQGQPPPLARRVDDDIQVPGTRPVRHTAGPVPGCVPFILLKPHRRAQATGAVGDAGQAGHELRGLQAQAHLVPVVLPADRGAMHPRPDLDPQDHAPLGDRAGLF